MRKEEIDFIIETNRELKLMIRDMKVDLTSHHDLVNAILKLFQDFFDNRFGTKNGFPSSVNAFPERKS